MSIEIVTTCQLNDGTVEKWQIGKLRKILYVRGSSVPFLALNSAKQLYSFSEESSWTLLDVENVLAISYGRNEVSYAVIISTENGCFTADSSLNIAEFSPLVFSSLSSSSEASFGVTRDGFLYGWGKNFFLGLIEEGFTEKPRKLEPFKNVISIECGSEHNLLLVERDVQDNESSADEDDAFNFDHDEHFGINILEDALVMAGNLDVEREKDEDKKEEKGKSLAISLTNSVEWLSQSTMNVTSVILPTPVTNIIASTIATTSSTISSTYSYGESLIKGFLSSQEKSRQKVRTDCVSQISAAPRALTDLYVWGRNGHGQLGTGDTADVIEPVKLQAVSSKGIIAILAQENLSFAVTSTWEVWAWGEDFQKETKLKQSSVLHTLTARYLSMPNTQATTQTAAGGDAWLNSRPALFIILSSSASELNERFTSYFRFLGKAVAGGFFDSLSKEFISKLEPKLKNSPGIITQQDSVADTLIEALSLPAKELKHHVKSLETLLDLTVRIEGPENPSSLEEVSVSLVHKIIEWLKLAIVNIQCIIEDFNRTRAFWNDPANLRYRKALVTADRFLVLTNRTIPVWPSGAVTQPAVLLFSDVLVIWTQLSIQQLPLNLLWIREYPDEKKVIVETPEENLTLVFKNPEDRDFWCSTLIQSVCRLLEQEDITRLPLTRKGLFQFKNGRLRGCTYMGDWENGKMHGKGFLTSPDNHKKYIGGFVDGERSGWGVFTNEMAKDCAIKTYTGFYENEQQNGIGEAVYGDGSVYKGCWKDGLRAGHGVQFYGSSHASVYLGDWSNDKRNGYGVLRSRLQGWRFLCLWKDDKKHGRGVFVSSSNVFTQSMFSFDQIIDKEGLVYANLTNISGIEEDRFFIGAVTSSLPVTVVDDSIQPEDVTLVKGKLSVLHDSKDCDKLATSVEGSFAGDILQPKITAGVDFKTIIVDSNLTGFFNLVGSVPSAAKWRGLFKLFVTDLGTPLSGPGDGWNESLTDKCWENLSEVVNNRKTTMFPDTPVSEQVKLTSRPTPDKDDEIKEYVKRALSSKLHPLGHVMSMIVKAFESSYTPTHTALIFASLAEIKSIIKVFHNVTRCFFPEIDPADAKMCAGSLILPSLFPQVYPILQSMYVESHTRVEERINLNLRRYRAMKDLSLAQLLGSDILEQMVIDAEEKPILISCVKKMRQFPLCILPDQKLDLICELFKLLKEELAKYNASYSADDLLPAMEFVMVRGMVTNLGVEIRIIKDFIHPDIQGGERGLWYCHFYTAYKSLSR
ncbi:Oidioi.mRNA.OKI2018_I69.chr2.g7047.t1.cds [Oikopleura dioica]|uniref:Oidioi.mRNA.OKI2018_I69.chr2.g7047.t1.cds n=1 Tax=Oikopleura dioica TaxID=34765 RepID=A0ABN7TBN9_OIKDI|nr:Oidioi.mRNA.OKI2018_I69.chr2.g7047.t1.cds [Oikopleura dioica]